MFNVEESKTPVVAFVARSSADEWDKIIPSRQNTESLRKAGREMQSGFLFFLFLVLSIRSWAFDVERSAFAFTIV